MPVAGNKLYCPDCGFEQPQINLISCNRCGCSLGAPNVNEVAIDNEKKALQDRYDNAISILNRKGLRDVAIAFESYFTANVRAVINISLPVLETILIKDDPYKNYYRITDEGVKNIALPVNDRRRCIVDGYMFGSYGTKMAFAALSLENTGLAGYDNCTIVLDQTLIQKRATILEENSYNFVKRHNINLEKPEIPLGYRSLWETKQMLAMAKVYEHIDEQTGRDDYNKLVLFSDGNRSNEEFMEVHIYNEITPYMINRVHIPKPGKRIDMLKIKQMQEKHKDKVFIA